MDTGLDFIRPEFLNILFFQQKNLVIFPYVDLKHLHSLEIFAEGHNFIDLEATAIHDLISIIKEEGNSYSQNPILFFIYHINRDLVKETIDCEVRCILNTSENVADLANGSNFIFFNKKSKKFINFDSEEIDLEFERHLISTSENELILHEKIQKLKNKGTQIFNEINKDPTLKRLPDILSDYDKKYWQKILSFVKFYFNIKVPNISDLNLNKKNKIKRNDLIDFMSEYDYIVEKNNKIAKEFIQLLHEYRVQHVNPSNLDLEELINPTRLFTYLRNNHWKEGISREFLFDWISMQITSQKLLPADIKDFKDMLQVLNVLTEEVFLKLDQLKTSNEDQDEIDFKSPINNIEITEPEQKPSIKDFEAFKKQLLKKLDLINEIISMK